MRWKRFAASLMADDVRRVEGGVSTEIDKFAVEYGAKYSSSSSELDVAQIAAERGG